MFKFTVLALFAIIAVVSCGILPAAYVSPYASTYNAHTINHAVLAPSAKIVAASPYSLPAYTYPYAHYSYPAFY